MKTSHLGGAANPFTEVSLHMLAFNLKAWLSWLCCTNYSTVVITALLAAPESQNAQ